MKKSTIVLCCLLILKFVLQYLLVHPIYELHRDEFLHLDQGKHLAWGYHSVPPVTSWISWLILKLGKGYFWVKFFPALFGALTILVVWKTVEQLKGNLFACFLSGFALLLSTFLRINLLFQPNSLDILCWTLVYYTLIRFIQDGKSKWLYIMALSFAIGFLNKYNIAFCLLGLLPALVISKHRMVFLQGRLYLAICLAFVCIFPNLFWQFQHDFPVFKHLKELADTQLVHINRTDFLKEQFFFFLGSLFILLAAFFGLIFYQPFKIYRFLGWSYLFTILIFLGLKAKGYYALGLYPILLAFGSVYIGHLLQNGWKFYLRYVCVAIIIILFIPMMLVALPIKSPGQYAAEAKQLKPFSEHTWEDGKKHPISQDFADMLSWKELASKVDSVYQATADQQHTLILCDNYGQAGAINYYSKIKGLTANAFTDDYINWIAIKNPIYTMIRVKGTDNPDLSKEKALFESVITVAKIETSYAREKGTEIIILSKPRADVKFLLEQEIKKRRE